MLFDVLIPPSTKVESTTLILLFTLLTEYYVGQWRQDRHFARFAVTMIRVQGCPRMKSRRTIYLLVTLLLIVLSIRYAFPNGTLHYLPDFASIGSYSVLRNYSLSNIGMNVMTKDVTNLNNEDVSTNLVKDDEDNTTGVVAPPVDVSPPTSASETLISWNHNVFQQATDGGSNTLRSVPIFVEDAVGYFHDEKLVVNLTEDYLFWNDGARRLCRILRNMTLTTTSIVDTQPVPVKSRVNVMMDCVDHAENKEGLGQGNWVTAVYSAKMATAVAGVDFQFQCMDGRDSQMKLLLPWFDQYQPAMEDRTVWPYGGERPTEIEVCPPKYPWLRIDHVASIIQDDVRRMAVTLVGTRDAVRRHPDVPEDAPPLIPDVELDDVALHFRCGDVLGGARRGDFGMIRFNEYKKWIPSDTKSIGILTQPFEPENTRKTDRRKTENCRKVVTALVDYLHTFAPDATISIHNGVNETLPLTYARLVMANYSITSLSSFGIFPVIGTFGQGYFQKGNRGVNPFASFIPSYLENIHEMDAEWMSTGAMWGKPVEDLIEWFIDDPNKEAEVEQVGVAEAQPIVVVVEEENTNSSATTTVDQPEGEAAMARETPIPWNDDAYRRVSEGGSNSLPQSIPIMVEDAVGYFHDEKLVVNLTEDYLYWNFGARKLCRILRNMTLTTTSIVDTQPVPVASRVNILMDCVDYAANRPMGQGNWVTAVYSAKMATAVAGVDFQFQCMDGRDSQMKLLLPWFDQYQPALKDRTVWPYDGERPTEKDVCSPNYPSLRIDHVASIIQDDVRRMAVTLVGTRDAVRRHPDVPEDAPPLIPNVELDDVALHFRCGDYLGGFRRGDLGMIRFNEYKKWIPSDAKSIGILTQPFEPENNRQKDRKTVDNCRKVVTALVDYLHTFAPDATISIHNGVNETLPLAYARLVMANYSITSLSSFGIFPVIGTFGQGYFQKGNSGSNPFANFIPSYFENIHEMDAEFMSTDKMVGRPVEDLIAWFVNDTETVQ